MADTQDRSISLKRTIDAPAEELFAAWTDPALLEQWQADRAEFEAFDGGSFRFETDDEDGTTHVVTGDVVSIEPDRRIVEIWRYQGEDDAQDESTLIVTFNALDADRTEIVLLEVSDAHEDPQSRIFSLEAWNEALQELAELLE